MHTPRNAVMVEAWLNVMGTEGKGVPIPLWMLDDQGRLPRRGENYISFLALY